MTKKEKLIIKGLLDRFCDCCNIEQVCSFKSDYKLLHTLGYNKIVTIDPNSILKNEIIFITYNKKNSFWCDYFIGKNKKNNIIVMVSNIFKKGESISLSFINSKLRVKILCSFFPNVRISAPKSFKVLAIIHVFNEEDIIENTIKYLLKQGIHVYIIDNHSTDNTKKIIDKLKKTHRKELFYKKFPSNNKNNKFEWSMQLKETERISRKIDYNWFMHYDSDEYRISPYENVSLKDFIYLVDILGFTLIDNTLIDFRITEKTKNNNIFMKDTYFQFNHRSGAFLQIKTWKKSKSICISKTGGHLAQVNNPKVFPLKILNRHYPLRSITQANNKIFRDRLPRYSLKERKIGWHTQYDFINSEKDFIYDKNNLIKWNNKTIHEYYIPLFFGIGINNIK